MTPPDELINQIKQDEGLRLTAYQDTLGNLTIGYGHLGAFPGQTITEAEANSLLMQDLNEAQSTLTSALMWVTSLDVVRYCTLWNMTFNMGIGNLLEFEKMLKACRDGNYAEAADQMANSLWAQQVKTRAIQLERQMRTGVWA